MVAHTPTHDKCIMVSRLLWSPVCGSFLCMKVRKLSNIFAKCLILWRQAWQSSPMKFCYRNLEVLAVVPPCEYYPNAGKYLCCLTFMHSIMSGNSFPRRFNTQGRAVGKLIFFFRICFAKVSTATFKLAITCVSTASMWVLGNWPTSLETCPVELEFCKSSTVVDYWCGTIA